MGPLWRAIWEVQSPNNIKVFTWRAMHNALPTRGNLEYRKIIPMAWCPLCGLQIETTFHALWECDKVKGGWDSSNIMVNQELPYRDFTTLVWEIFDHQGKEGLTEFMAVSWQLWHMRNRKIHEGQQMDTQRAILLAHTIMEEYQAAYNQTESSSQVLQQQDNLRRWEVPRETMYKINVDGALLKTPKIAGMGVIIRNNEGLPMASLMASRHYVTDPAAAELFAAIQGLQLAHDIGIRRIILEGDSLNTMKALCGCVEEYSNSWLGNEVMEARHLLEKFEVWKTSIIRREANVAAHRLARQALQSSETIILMEDVPDFVRDQLQLDVAT